MTDRPVPTGPAAPDLTIVETRVYRGPNIWSYGPAIHLVVDLGSLEEYPSDALPGFTDQLFAWLPGVGEHSCSRGRKGGFAERLREGTWVGHVAEHVALQLQNEAGHDTRRGKTRSTGEPGRYHVIFGYQDEAVALAAGKLAVRMVNDLVSHDPEFDFDAQFEEFLLLAERTAFGPSTQALIDEAVSRDIPWMRLNSASLVQLGQGRYAAADPRHHDLEHLCAGRGHRQRQGHHQQAVERRRAPGSQERLGADAARCPSGRPADRIPGGHQAAGRQPRPGCGPQHHRRRRAGSRLRRGQG